MAVSRITRWRLMSVIFGIKCLFLMVTLGVLLINSFTIQNIQSTPSPTTTVEFQEEFYELQSNLFLDWNAL
uniref:Killer cell lectin-like receptor, subfamily D, member 1 n=1 Tax=Mus musculus TaxID=10090 RepID=E0CZ14_MOUSE